MKARKNPMAEETIEELVEEERRCVKGLRNSITMAALTLIVCGVVVVAASADITPCPVYLSIHSTSATPGGDLPNYTSGDLIVAQQYDMLVRYETSRAIEDVAVAMSFTNESINATYVEFYWTDGIIDWVPMIWTENAGEIVGTFGNVDSSSSGDVVEYYVKFSYMVVGNYHFSMVVIGSVAW